MSPVADATNIPLRMISYDDLNKIRLLQVFFNMETYGTSGLLSEKSTTSWRNKISTLFEHPLEKYGTEHLAEPRRWRVVLIYGFASIGAVVNWNLWSPIANSALYAFPKWHPRIIVILNTWGPAIFLLGIVPSVRFLNSFGVKSSLVVSVAFSTVGAALRLIQIESIYTVMVNIAAILNAIGGVFLTPCVLPLTSLWFPYNERNISLSICTCMGMAGVAVSFLFGPFIVADEPEGSTPSQDMRTIIRSQIMILCFIAFLCELLLLIIMVLIFPARPNTAPSRSTFLKTNTPRVSGEIWNLLKNSNYVVITLALALTSGITGPWLTMLSYIFKTSGLTQTESSKLGFLSILCSCCWSIAISALSDQCPKYTKYIIMCILVPAIIMFIVILFMAIHLIKFERSAFSLCVICGLSLVWSIPPLFYNLAAEVTYPISEGTVGGFVTAAVNVMTFVVYLLLQIFQYSDFTWMTYLLVVFTSTSFILLLFVTEDHYRLDVDLTGISFAPYYGNK